MIVEQERKLRFRLQNLIDSHLRGALTAAITDSELEDIKAVIPEAEELIRTDMAKLIALMQLYGLSTEYINSVKANQEASLSRSSEFLLAALVAYASGQLLQTGPMDEVRGEVSPDFVVPHSIVRGAMNIAGGAQGPDVVDSVTGQFVGGVWTGLDARDMYAKAGISPVGWKWVYGSASRTQPFHPHAELDGTEFTSWDDSKLAVHGESWLGVSHYRPGDHHGCMCDVEPIIIENGENAPSSDELEEIFA